MGNDNNNSTSKSNMPQPTMLDLFNLLNNTSTKEDLSDIKRHIDDYKAETNVKIEAIDSKFNALAAQNDEQSNQIDFLQANIEQLKQDQLKNNICISGIPPNLIQNDNTADLIISMASKLGVDINRNQFSSFAVAHGKFIICKFNAHNIKQTLLSKIRVKKSLLVEEVFGGQSNSQIYLNDHLTPHLSRLYLIARRAKKDGALASATSFGGKIRARKNADDAPTTILSEHQLLSLIESDCGDNTNSMSASHQQADDVMDTSATSSIASQTNNRSDTGRKNTASRSQSVNNKSNNNTTQGTRRPYKRRATADTNKEDKTQQKKQRA